MEDTPQITNEEEKPKVEELFEQMRVSTKRAPVRKKVDPMALKDNVSNKPQYKVLKLKTKEGSIEDGVKLDEGTIVVKKIKGIGVVLEKEDKLYEMVTKDGASMFLCNK
jgi:hypothetical protein